MGHIPWLHGKGQRFSVSSAPAVCFHSNPSTQGSSALSLGEGCQGGYHACPLSCLVPHPPPSASGEEHRVAAAIRVQAGPDPWPCLTLVPTKPCDKTRPQERGFNKRYRFLELRLGDFPEDRLCLAGGLCAAGTELCTAGTRLFPSSSAVPASCHPLSQSDYLERLHPSGPSVPMAWLSFQHQPQEWWSRADPGGPSSDL